MWRQPIDQLLHKYLSLCQSPPWLVLWDEGVWSHIGRRSFGAGKKQRLFASDQPLWIPTDIVVGPCPAESATGQMEEMPHPGDGHVWPLYGGALGRIRLLQASGKRLQPLTAIWNVGTAVPGDCVGGERLVRLSDIAC